MRLILGALAALALTLSPASGNDGVLSDYVRETRTGADIVGMGAGVMVGGEIVAIAVDGERVIGEGDPIAPDAVWHLGSVSKSMTATLAAVMVEDGLISFDTTVGEIFGDVDIHESWQDVTLAELLTHRSGAAPNFSPLTQFTPQRDTTEEIAADRQAQVTKIISKRPAGEHGDFAYSNVGFTIAGAMLERVGGAPWEDLMGERLFGPLGITPGFGPPKGEGAAWGHRKGFFGKAPVNPAGNADNPQFMGPAATVALSIEDLLGFGQAHLSNDPALLSQGGFARLITPPGPDAETGSGYAYGLVIQQEGRTLGAGPMIWHNGSNTLWTALLVILPDEDMVLAFVANDGDFEGAEAAFWGLARRILENPTLTP